MSTPTIVVLIVLVAFACALGLCEWVARRMHETAERDREQGPPS
jgi:hypothetical protein